METAPAQLLQTDSQPAAGDSDPSDPETPATEGTRPSSVFQRLRTGGEADSAPAADSRHRSVWERLQAPGTEAVPGDVLRDPQGAEHT